MLDTARRPAYNQGMRPLLRAARAYPLVVATITVAAVAGVLSFTPARGAVPWVLGVFAICVAARSAWSMIGTLRSGSFGVDILAVTAIVSSVVVGQYWASLVIVLMLTGGEALEDYAAGRAKRDLHALLSHAPQHGHRVQPDGTVDDVDIAEIAPGDTILVRSGEVVPVDGTLASASGEFDDSSLTGESLPVQQVAGDEVLSGAVNGADAVTLTVKRAAKDSQFQQIMHLVEAATASKSPMVRLADRIALPFTIVSFAIAIVAWVTSGDAVRFAEVLVVATPCPLIIAAPVAFMAGMSRSAREGAIIKSSATLELLHRARSFAFDKTGTLTTGVPTLAETQPTAGWNTNDLLRLVASAEQSSTHVLAAAAVTAAQAGGVTLARVSDAKEVTGQGITATVDGKPVVVGKRSFVAAQVGADVAAATLSSGEIAVYAAVDGQYAGALLFRDAPRPEAQATIADLRRQGITEIVMLTGDDQATAEAVATAVGITDIRANCLPLDKVNDVRALPQRPVVMVGDGVNDAPVLAVADVGIAMGARGSTAASESADVVILRDDLSRVSAALAVGKHTVDVALQSMSIGIGLSIILMCIAASGVLPAIAGAWIQEGVDVVSILWALRATTGARRGASGRSR